MSRTGNHGIIRWITAHFQESKIPIYFFNNTNLNFLKQLNFIHSDLNNNKDKVLLVSFEDVVINEQFAQLTSIADHNVLLLRDPLNLFASRLEGLTPSRGLAIDTRRWESKAINKSLLNIAKNNTMQALPGQINIYLNHYEEFHQKKCLLQNKLCISYNQWVADKEYRKKIIEEDFKLKFTDAKYNVRANSSFGKLGTPKTHEDYLNRWKLYWNSDAYQAIKNNETLIKIANDFGINTEQ